MVALTQVHAIVHARMSSRRLPGKVMRKAHGVPLLGHLLDRLAHCKGLDGVMIATSSDPSDDQISEYAAARRFRCYRGDLNDVAGRLIMAANKFGIEHLVRISGDSPVMDPAIVSRALDIYRGERPDLVTNVQERTFPKGQSVEILALESLAEAWARGMSDADKEHVTSYFYKNSAKYSIVNLRYPAFRGDVQLSVDTEQDFIRIEQILSRLGEPFWVHGLEELLRAYDVSAVQ